MNKTEAKKRIEELREITDYHARRYYDEDSPEISDFEYDLLMNELKNLEKQYPEYISDDSLTQKVGGTVKEGFKKIAHEVPLQSLQDVFDFEEIRNFDLRIREQAKEFKLPLQYVVETKIDGLSTALEYKNGIFTKGATRGDGQIGEDVTENLKTISHVPKKINESIDITVRGEVFIGKKEFEKLNNEREILEEPLFANSRNAAAGSLRQLDSNIAKTRPLDIFIFNVQKCERKDFTSHYEALNYLEKMGFNVVPIRVLCNTIDEVIDEINKIGAKREELDFGIDGAVIKVDNLELREKLGTTFKTPKWAIAYKYPPEQIETSVKDIICQVGRTGAITPLAILEPVKLAGSTISKTTLHNEDFIKDKDIRIGDIVVIQKAGDVIPEVVGVKKEKRKGTEKKFEMPKLCPVCGGPVIRESGEAVARCIGIECKAVQLRSIAHFASKDGMDINGLGIAIIEELINRGLINNIADIYKLNLQQLASLKKNGKKFAQNLLEAIENSKKNDLSKLINALGIRHLGNKTSKLLAKRYKTINAISQASFEELSMIEDIGPVIADSVFRFFAQEQTKDLINKLKEAGINMEHKEQEMDERFYGKTFVLTGALSNYTRDEAIEIIEKFGGKTSNSVSKKTSYVLVGDEAGSKLTKAEQLGVQILTEQEFIEMIK